MNHPTTDPPALPAPDVFATRARTVTMHMTVAQAEVLARILAHYDVLTDQAATADGFDRAAWMHTLVDLLRARAVASLAGAPLLTLVQGAAPERAR